MLAFKIWQRHHWSYWSLTRKFKASVESPTAFPVACSLFTVFGRSHAVPNYWHLQLVNTDVHSRKQDFALSRVRNWTVVVRCFANTDILKNKTETCASSFIRHPIFPSTTPLSIDYFLQWPNLTKRNCRRRNDKGK